MSSEARVKTILLEGVGLKKRYPQGLQGLEVLHGVDLAVGRGEMVAIVGPSGSGKSTLLNLLGGLDLPTGGQVRYEGKDLYGLSDRERSGVRNRSFGFVFQSYHLVPELTAMENALLPGWIGNGRGLSPEVVRRGTELLERVGLKERFSHRPAELSGGEQQRVAIARALLNEPRIVFCDEPTGNLDQETGDRVLGLLQELHQKQGVAFVVVTHEPSVTKIAGRVLTLKDGRLWP